MESTCCWLCSIVNHWWNTQKLFPILTFIAHSSAILSRQDRELVPTFTAGRAGIEVLALNSVLWIGHLEVAKWEGRASWIAGQKRIIFLWVGLPIIFYLSLLFFNKKCQIWLQKLYILKNNPSLTSINYKVLCIKKILWPTCLTRFLLC